MIFGTTNVEILSSGGDIDVNVGGADVIDLSSTEITVDDLITLIAKKLTTEVMTVATTAGADGVVKTDATKMQVGSTDASPLEILVNNIARMTVGTDGKVALATVGTASDELIDKDYVDTGDASAATITNTLTTIGASSLDDGTGVLLLKWGVIAGAGTPTPVTFAIAFPNALFTVFLTPEDAGTANSDGWANTTARSVTGFDIIPAGRGGAYTGNWNWFAIGN
jgi:hypothetical protein